MADIVFSLPKIINRIINAGIQRLNVMPPEPSISITPSITPTISVTPSITITPSITPTITPSITISPTPTPSSNPYYVAGSYNCLFNNCNQYTGQVVIYAGGTSLNIGLFYTSSNVLNTIYQPVSLTSPQTIYTTVNPISFLSCADACIKTTPSVTPSATPSITPSITPTITPSVTPSVTPSITLTITPSATPSLTITPTETPTPSITPTISVTPTISISKTPSITPTITVTPTISVTPSVTGTPYLSPTSTPVPSQTPSITPTISVSITPSITPTPSTSCARPGGLTDKKLWVSYTTTEENIIYISTSDYNYACSTFSSLIVNTTPPTTSSITSQASSYVNGQKVYVSGSTSCSGVGAGSYWMTTTATSASALIAAGTVDIVTINSSGIITAVTNCTP